jgi:serine/threonine protein kinase
VHRDVKPANILVDVRPGRPDHVYLSDFGVSKGATASVSLTGAGVFLGTPDYLAPEQIQGQPVDGRADQYALACVAFQLLTGQVPFERDQAPAPDAGDRAGRRCPCRGSHRRHPARQRPEAQTPEAQTPEAQTPEFGNFPGYRLRDKADRHPHRPRHHQRKRGRVQP